LIVIKLCVYAAATMFVGMTFPFFDGLLGFFGGFGFAPTTYYVGPTPSFISFTDFPLNAWLVY